MPCRHQREQAGKGHCHAEAGRVVLAKVLQAATVVAATVVAAPTTTAWGPLAAMHWLRQLSMVGAIKA